MGWGCGLGGEQADKGGVSGVGVGEGVLGPGGRMGCLVERGKLWAVSFFEARLYYCDFLIYSPVPKKYKSRFSRRQTL